MAKKDMHRLQSMLVESQFKPVKIGVAAALVYHNITGKTRTAASGQEYEAALADTAIALSQVADLYYTNAQGRLTRIPEDDLMLGKFERAGDNFAVLILRTDEAQSGSRAIAPKD